MKVQAEPMTPPGARMNFYTQYQYQMSPLSRAPPMGSTQFYQFNTNRFKEIERMSVNNNNSYHPPPAYNSYQQGYANYQQQQGYNSFKQQRFASQGDASDVYPSQSFFSHSFSVPIPPAAARHDQRQAFPVGSPPAAGLYHIPPINTNSPDSGLGDYSALKSLSDSLRIKDDGGI